MKPCFHLVFILNSLFQNPGPVTGCLGSPSSLWACKVYQMCPEWMAFSVGFFQVWNDETFSTKDLNPNQVSETWKFVSQILLAMQIGCENLTKSLPTKTRHRFLIFACLEICPKILRNLWRLIWLREWRLEGENAMASTEDTSESLCSLRSFKGVVYIVRKYYIYIYLYIYVYVPPISYMCVYTCVIYL